MKPEEAAGISLLIRSVDSAPDDLYEQTPFSLTLVRELPGNDRPDYWLAKVDRAIQWRSENGERTITHVVIAARWERTAIAPGIRDFPVNIAYVTDPSLLDDERLDFAKTAYVAIGTADALAPPKRRTWIGKVLGVVALYAFVAVVSLPILVPLFLRSRMGALVFLIFVPPLYIALEGIGERVAGPWGERTPLMKAGKFLLFIVGALVLMVALFISAIFGAG